MMPQATPSVVFMGAATLDVVALVPRYPSADERQIADAVEWAGGGPAATAAVACARMGVPASFVGCVGDDDEGHRIRESLSTEGVDVSGLQVAEGRRSGVSVVVVDRTHSTRAINTRPVPALDLSPAGMRLLEHADWIHVDHLGWSNVKDWRPRSRNRPRLSVDAGNPIADFAPRDVDLYVPTAEGLRRDFGDGSLDDLADAAIAAGVETVVATMGAAGSMGVRRGGERASAAALRTPLVSTLGAGDVFHGALLAAVLRDYPLARCLAYANAAAGLSCRALDGRSAIPTHEETLAAMQASEDFTASASEVEL